MPESTPSALLGCLLDVSDSMREALHTGRANEPAVGRLRAVLRTALRIARAEQSRSGDALMFVGVFGLNEHEKCPSVVDLCGVVEALLDIRGDNTSGHDLLTTLAAENNRSFIAEYIQENLDDNQARILYKQCCEDRELFDRFINLIPTDNQRAEARTSVKGKGIGGGAALGVAFGFAIGGPFAPIVGICGGGFVTQDGIINYFEEKKINNSEALNLAYRSWEEWWGKFIQFQPRPIGGIIKLLERLQDHSQETSSEDVQDKPNNILDVLGKYIYGLTPMHEALSRALEVFDMMHYHHKTIKQRVLMLVSDGLWTDKNPLDVARRLTRPSDLEKEVILAVVHLTNDLNTPRRRLYDCKAPDWDKGQSTLFEMATRITGGGHPIPVLASLGWEIPSSGEFSLYASVCTAATLDEFFSMLLSARFGSADVLLDLVGRIKLGTYINDKHARVRSKPSRQEGGTCYAHATATVLKMAHSRVIRPCRDQDEEAEDDKDDGCPSIYSIRKRILETLPETDKGWPIKEVLKTCTGPDWYPPIFHYEEVNEDAARQAVLCQRPVLTTFDLSETGWEVFSQHFGNTSTARSVLTCSDMERYRSEPSSGEGHAVVLVGCSSRSLTFLNSWGDDWGDGGKFEIEDHTVLESKGCPVKFYDVFWRLEDLSIPERTAFTSYVDEEVRLRAAQYPSIFQFEACCPLCNTCAPIADFTGSIHEAKCPRCDNSFIPEPGHLVQALYLRAGLSDGL